MKSQPGSSPMKIRMSMSVWRPDFRGSAPRSVKQGMWAMTDLMAAAMVEQKINQPKAGADGRLPSPRRRLWYHALPHYVDVFAVQQELAGKPRTTSPISDDPVGGGWRGSPEDIHEEVDNNAVDPGCVVRWSTPAWGAPKVPGTFTMSP